MSFKLFNYDKNIEFWKILNFVVVSDSDKSYILEKNLKKAKIFRIIYLLIVLFAIFLSFIPLFFSPTDVSENRLLSLPFNWIAFIVLIIDYGLRWITFPLRIEDKRAPLLFFPFTGVSIIMFFSFLPSILIVFFPAINISNSGSLNTSNSSVEFISIVNSLLFLRLGRLLLLLNVFTPFKSIKNVFVKQRVLLFNVFVFLIIVAILFALIIFQAEVGAPKSGIKNYWNAFYFTIITLTTIGYGDIVPVTPLGQAIVVILAIIGVALFTIPAGIIAGGFLQELQENAKKEIEKSENKIHKKSTFLQKTIDKSVSSLIKVAQFTSKPIKDNKLKSSKKNLNTEEDITLKENTIELDVISNKDIVARDKSKNKNNILEKDLKNKNDKDETEILEDINNKNNSK